MLVIEFASQGADTSIDGIEADQRPFPVAPLRSKRETRAVVVAVHGNRFAKETHVFLRA